MRVFVLKHKRVEEAALLDPAAPLRLGLGHADAAAERDDRDGPARRSSTRSARCSPAFDMPPRGFTFAVKLVRARADVPDGSIAREIGGLGAKLKSLFQFNDYALIDSASCAASEGGRVDTQLGEEYMLSFTIRPAGAGNELLLSPFTLSQGLQGRRAGRRAHPAALPLVDARSRSRRRWSSAPRKEEKSKSALILILLRPGAAARRRGRRARREAAEAPRRRSRERVPRQGRLAGRLGRRAVGRWRVDIGAARLEVERRGGHVFEVKPQGLLARGRQRAPARAA